MNRRELLIGASAAGVAVDAALPRIDAAAFGVTGDGRTDDAAAIQAALDHAGSRGGGAVRLPLPKVHYRIASGLVLPSHVSLEGEIPVAYSFNAGNAGACALVADFADPSRWMIETATRTGGGRIGFNQVMGGALPDGVTYNCGVRNLLLTSKGKVPYGGIRMHGCPGSFVDGVSINRVGCGLLVNHCSGGIYRANIRALYYGVAAWDEANGNVFQVYCTQSTPWPKTVPPSYQLPFMAQMAGHFADTLKLSSDAHGERPYGILCGSIASTSTGNAFDAVIERFAGGLFLYNAYVADFRQSYLESEASGMVCALTASRSRFSIQSLHAYLSGSGALFDFGIDVTAKIFASGILDAASFGKPPLDDGSSLLLIEGIAPPMHGAPLQRGIRYAGKIPEWIDLSLRSGWRTAGEVPAVRVDPWSYRVEWKGSMTGGQAGVACVLPPSCRPPRRGRYRVAGGQVEITPDGVVTVQPDDVTVDLDSIGFSRW